MAPNNPKNPVAQSHRPRRKSRSQPASVHKPHGEISRRVQKAGPDKFAIVCCDPAKHRSEWMMTDYFGNLLIPPRTVDHDRPHLEAAVAAVKLVIQTRELRDVIVAVERTGRFHLPFKRAFAAAGFETRVVHPFTVKQYRLPAHPGNKTDQTDLFAQYRAVVAGFALGEQASSEVYRALRLLIRHRRELVHRNTMFACQIKEHLQLTLPGYTALFENFWAHQAARTIARIAVTPPALLAMGRLRIAQELAQRRVRFQPQTLDKVLAWARNAPAPDPDALLHHRLWTDLDELRDAHETRIFQLEREIAAQLAQTPYILLLAIPGINIVSAADLAGEMGPIEHYANANAITGRAGLFPSRYQSDTTDRADGPLVQQANRRLRGALMTIADNLSKLNRFFRGQADIARQQKVDPRVVKVKIAKRLTRLIFACVAGRQVLRHPCCQDRASILNKLRAFHVEHHTPPQQLMADLDAAFHQLPQEAYDHEHQTLADALGHASRRQTGPVLLADLLPPILARLKRRADSDT